MNKLLNRIKGIFSLLLDPAASKLTKLEFILSIIYFVSPIEFLPDIFFPFGFIDDLILWGCLIYYNKEKLDSYADTPPKTKRHSKKYKGAMEVEFEVCDDESSSSKQGEDVKAEGEEQC